MANIIVNNKMTVKGKISVNRTINEEKNGFIISGIFATHLYLEDIKSLETNRFFVSGIEVYSESFGSDDYNIQYQFVAKNFKLKDIINDGVGYILYLDEMKQIEEEMYKNEHPVLGDIGEQYKDMYNEDNDDEEEDDRDDIE